VEQALALGGDLSAAFDDVSFPAYLVDVQGRIRGLNRAAIQLFGDTRGKFIWSVVAPDEREPVRERIARKLLSPTTTDVVASLRDVNGQLRRLDVSSTSLLDHDGRIVGVFGLMHELDVPPTREHADYHLSPRQRQVLGCLVAGASTDQMAERMQLAPSTVRNHVRGLLGALDVHSRVEAVALAVRENLVPT
jgi:PAS domain S-box-containing protein